MLRGAATTRLDAPQQLQPATGHPQVLTAAIDNTRKENTLLVPLTTQARYAACCNEATYLQDVKRYYLPGFEGGAYRAFEVEGGSMSPTFGSSDIVVCSLVDRWDLLKPRECYVVVTTENLLLKRINVVITDQSSTFELHSDNPGYEPYRLPVADLKELWLVRGYLSRIVPARPVNLEASTERLQELVDRLGRDFQDAGQALDKRGR